MLKSYIVSIAVCLVSIIGMQASDDGCDDFAFDWDATGRIFDVADPDAMHSLGSIKDYEEGDRFEFLPFAGNKDQHDAVIIVRNRSGDMHDVHYSLWNGKTWKSINKFYVPNGTTIENVEVDDVGVMLFYDNETTLRFRIPDIRKRAVYRNASALTDNEVSPAVVKKQKRDV